MSQTKSGPRFKSYCSKIQKQNIGRLTLRPSNLMIKSVTIRHHVIAVRCIRHRVDQAKTHTAAIYRNQKRGLTSRPRSLIIKSVTMLSFLPLRISAFMKASSSQSGVYPASFSFFRSSSSSSAQIVSACLQCKCLNQACNASS